MPGGRLTHQDRQLIAAGLAEDLGYAEIARQLDRPTSTVSREVQRNGGPAGYRADHAHQSTERRARRSKPSPDSALPDLPGVPGRDPAAVRDFEQRFVAVIVQMGLPRMAARVLNCLFTTDSGSLTAAELVQRLRVSPASVSKAVGYLEGLAMVRRERDSRRRRERYFVDDDVWMKSWWANTKTNQAWSDTAKLGAELFDPASPAGARLENMSQFLAQLAEDMGGGLTEAAAIDALTLLAALVHAGAPLTADELAAGLDWLPERVAAALRDAEKHPSLTDPVALAEAGPDSYTFTVERLTEAQRAAIPPSGRT